MGRGEVTEPSPPRSSHFYLKMSVKMIPPELSQEPGKLLGEIHQKSLVGVPKFGEMSGGTKSNVCGGRRGVVCEPNTGGLEQE